MAVTRIEEGGLGTDSFNLPVTLNGTDGSATDAGDNIVLDASASGVDAGERLLYEGIPPDSNDLTSITTSSISPSSADGATIGTSSAEWSDLYLADGGVIYFGNDQDVTVTHDPDDGLFLKSTATADDNPFLLTLQTGETDLAANDVIGKIAFQAPDEGTGTDAILVSAAIQAVAEGDHSSSSNATKLSFMTGASEAATEKMTISSTGDVVIKGTTPTLTIGDAGAEDAAIIFDGNAQDYHIGLDDTADSLAIGLGSALGTTDHMVFDATGAVTKPLQPAFYAWTSAVNTVATGATTELAWNTERFDTNADFDLTGERFTAPVAGVYLLQCTIGSVWGMGTTDGGRISLYLYKNGSLYEEFCRLHCAAGVDWQNLFAEHFMSGTLIDKAAADDYYEMFGQNSTGSTISFNYTQNYASFSGVLLG